MKRVLGLDLGTTSIGWAYVIESDDPSESKIIDAGVRLTTLTTDEQKNFAEGKPITTNADRTLKRSMRRNLQRYKLRRSNLMAILKELGFIDKKSKLYEDGEGTTHETLRIRARAANKKVSKEEFARILLSINKKRGYKSNRKMNVADEEILDEIDIAKELVEKKWTPGQHALSLLNAGQKKVPKYYRSDLYNELRTIIAVQGAEYPDIFNERLLEEIDGLRLQATSKLFRGRYDTETAENKGSRQEKNLRAYEWRVACAKVVQPKEIVTYVMAQINNDIVSSSGYLAAIGDRSKELYFNNQTVGEYLYAQIRRDRHQSLVNQVFYRNDYIEEFDKIWSVQRELRGGKKTWSAKNQEAVKKAIFYQRRLKSQKHLVSHCQLENQRRVAPKSSPLFQEFRIWQGLQNLTITSKLNNDSLEVEEDAKKALAALLEVRETMSQSEILKALGLNGREWKTNVTNLSGNVTRCRLYQALQDIIDMEGSEIDLSSMSYADSTDSLKGFFKEIGVSKKLLKYNPLKKGDKYDKQLYYQLWHLLYSYEGDNSKTGIDGLVAALMDKFGFSKKYAKRLSLVVFESDYGSLSSRAIRGILPYMYEHQYAKACEMAGYNHSQSVTKEENNSRQLKEQLDLLPKNSLRNPVVEKILNQMINVVNAIITDDRLGPPDEIRVEMARDLKNSQKERKRINDGINEATRNAVRIKKIIREKFNISRPSRNDVIRYRLYEELATNGYKTLYTNMYIRPDQLFSPEIEIEHIIPRSRLFDDSYSNKTLAFSAPNKEKDNQTAYDYLASKGSDALHAYIDRANALYAKGAINKAKFTKLLKKGGEIGEGFIERDLRETQYITKKALSLLKEVCRQVHPTSGKITDELREHWGLMNTLKELNLPVYSQAGMTTEYTDKNGNKQVRIVDWTKRSDHRHHAMDAIVVAFTPKAIVQYVNNLNAASNKDTIFYNIRNKYTYRDDHGKRRYKAPMINMRSEVTRVLSRLLISHNIKNKVTTRNVNEYKVKGGTRKKIQLTPRGQLHKETIYGKRHYYQTKEVAIGSKMTRDMAELISSKVERGLVMARLAEHEYDPKKAFGGANSVKKKPIYLPSGEEIGGRVKITIPTAEYTIRKPIDATLKIDKVVDVGIKRVLQKRLEEYDGDPKKAFAQAEMELNPIWLNKEKGIAIKRVTIKGPNEVVALHDQRDHRGKRIKDKKGKPHQVDYVSTGNNHHVAIYESPDGKWHEKVVSLMEAVTRVNAGLSPIDHDHNEHLGWRFLFTMKQNEMFVLPSDDFDPSEIDLLDPANQALVSPHLFRVQKLTYSDYSFRQHLDTSTTVIKDLRGATWDRIQSISKLKGCIKVRINHLSQIVHVGEYY